MYSPIYTFQEIKKAAKKASPKGIGFKLAILGDSSTQFLAVAIKGYANLENIEIDVFDAGYNQIDAQILNPESEVCRFEPDAILLYLSSERLYEEFMALDVSNKCEYADTVMAKIEKYWDIISSRIGCKIFQPNFVEIDDSALGNYSCKCEQSFNYQIRRLNFLIQEKMGYRNNLFPVDLQSIQSKLGREFMFDSVLFYNAKMAISMDALPFVARSIVNIVRAMKGQTVKCVIFDLDGTVWGGVIGDDGLGGIEIGEYKRGRVFSDIQRWFKQLKDYGVVLAVCSKNDELVAKEPFEKHDDMILRLSDIAVFVANWNDKASNIKLIQETLNIGMDSIVFIDDNPFERELVRQKIADIMVPELPADPANYLEFLQNMRLFEVISLSGEDKNRTEQYQTEFKRIQEKNSFESIDDYLKSLEMVSEAKPFEPEKYARIAQLTQRSNQFNLRTIRYTEDDIARIAADKNYYTIYYTLKDKFGDHGLVSVVILEKRKDGTLFIDTWLMSCRVLKRGMEEFIVNDLIDFSFRNGYKKIFSEYIPTTKNRIVKDLYRLFGFTEYESGKYYINVEEYCPRKNYISLLKEAKKV